MTNFACLLIQQGPSAMGAELRVEDHNVTSLVTLNVWGTTSTGSAEQFIILIVTTRMNAHVVANILCWKAHSTNINIHYICIIATY